MDCPTCDSGLKKVRVDDLVTHNYCPECSPGYQPPGKPTVLEKAAITMLLGAVLPAAWLYLQYYRWRSG